MPLPIAKGVIIVTSIVLAAGLAIYHEDERFREWIDSSRRKIAMTLHSLGDGINPRQHRDSDDESDSPEAEATRRRRRQEIIRMNRLELIRQAQSEGIAVDLDELESMGTSAQGSGFDSIVMTDGTLRDTANTTATDLADGKVRRRGTAGSRGFERGTLYANPFDDEAQVLFDQQLIGTDEDETATLRESRGSTKTSQKPADEPLIDYSADGPQYKTEEEFQAEIEEALRRSVTDYQATEEPTLALPAPSTQQPHFPPEDQAHFRRSSAPSPELRLVPPMAEMAENALSASPFIPSLAPATEASFHSAVDEQSDSRSATAVNDSNTADDDFCTHSGAATPTGTMTPTEDGLSRAASVASFGGEDMLSEFASVAGEADSRSETGFSEAYSVIGGVDTPGSWTDVESEAGDEEGHAPVQGTGR
ncbi:hypothetical protein EJ06DRAFT_529128 [Trichodelitschia bisporula]|uniref:Uncharacterized protein n=1 Tax=Trichodelitschia bisporula TaxID=703511 RepID=A0A6G1I135_9PEZI|nr:hypothetical protein EJ06DRAFT_529128 [Trichodelitschia bisporula]